MKKLLIITTLSILSFSSMAFAGDKVTIHVNGMVCDFCAQALEKVFLDEEQVEALDISLDNATVTVTLKDGKNLSDEELAFLITDSGYDVDHVERQAK